MSVSSAYSDLSPMGKDTTIELGRITALQFVATDLIIAKTYQSIFKRITKIQDDRIYSSKANPFNNPYELTIPQLTLIQELTLPVQMVDKLNTTTNDIIADSELKEYLNQFATAEKDSDPSGVRKNMVMNIIERTWLKYSKRSGKKEHTDLMETNAESIEAFLNSQFPEEIKKIHENEKKHPGNYKTFKELMHEVIPNFISKYKNEHKGKLQAFTVDPDTETQSLSMLIRQSEEAVDLTICPPGEKPGKYPDDYIQAAVDKMQIIDVFKLYKISHTVQKMLSHVLSNIRKIQDFRVEPDTVALERSFDLYGTENQPDEQSLEYFVRSTEQLVADKLASANPGVSIGEREMAIIIELVQHVGYLIAKPMERFDSESDGNVTQELRERNLTRILFPPLPDPTVKKCNDPDIPLIRSYHLSTLLDDLGFTDLFDLFDEDLPDEVFEVEDSEVLTNPLSLWGPIFVDSDPELFDILSGLIPTVADRYRLPPSQSLSEAQHDLWPGAVAVMEEFLKKTFMKSRTDEIEYLVNNCSADLCLWTLRNLRVLVNKKDGIQLNGIAPGKRMNIWGVENDSSNRIPFNFMINWLLSDEKKLGEPFRYALSILKVDEKRYFFDDLKMDKIDSVVASAMFTGELDSSQSLPKGGKLIDLNYNREQKNKQILMTRLGQNNGLEAALSKSKVRMP